MLKSIWGSQFIRLTGHAVIYGTSGVLGKVAALLAVPYLTRQLGPADYGLVDLATSLSALLVLLVRFAGDIPTMRFAAATEDHKERRRIYTALVVATWLVSVLAATALLPLAGAISVVLWSSPDATPLAIAALALVPINALQASLASLLRMTGRPRMFAIAATADLLAQVGCAVALVAAGLGAIGVVLGYLLGGMIGMAIAAVLVRGYLVRDVRWPTVLSIFQEGLPFLPGIAAFYIADTISRILAVNVLGVVAVGQLALAIRIASVMALASGAFASAWGPVGLALRPSPAARVLIGRVSVALAAFIGMASVGVGAFAPELTTLVGGDGFVQAAEAVPALVLSAGLGAVLYLLTTAAGIGFRGRWVSWTAGAGAAAQVGATLLLLPSLGIGGFAVGSVLGRLVTVWALWASVSDLAPIRAASIVLSVGIVGTALIQALNAQPTDTFALRAVVALCAVAIGSLALWRAAFPGLTKRRQDASVAGRPLN
jgi:O-antigen/teichoic acid export membrane protein